MLYPAQNEKTFHSTMIVLTLFVVVTNIILVFTEDTHRNHTVLRITPSNDLEVSLLNIMRLGGIEKINLWDEPAPSRLIMADTHPEDNQLVVQVLKEIGIKYEVATNDMQAWLDEQKGVGKVRKLARGYDYNAYNTYDKMLNELNRIASVNSSTVKVKSIGTTYEKRSIPVIEISKYSDNTETVCLECGMHAREWVAPSSCMGIVKELTTGGPLSDYLEYYNFAILPVANPDGYDYTWTGTTKDARLWRKNRAPDKNGNIGVDVNRNMDSGFGTVGISKDPTSDIFCGNSAFSENESKALRDYLSSMPQKGQNLLAYFAIHSYSQLWMYPSGTSKKLPPNYKDLDILSKAAIDAIKQSSGKVYKHGPIATTIYLASGSTTDWCYEKGLTDKAFAVELRDEGKQGFLLDSSQIEPTRAELSAGIAAVLDKCVEAGF